MEKIKQITSYTISEKISESDINEKTKILTAEYNDTKEKISVIIFDINDYDYILSMLNFIEENKQNGKRVTGVYCIFELVNNIKEKEHKYNIKFGLKSNEPDLAKYF